MWAVELGREKSRRSHHIARMTDRGLVTKEKCGSDPRGSFVVITPLGRKEIEAVAPSHVKAVRRHFLDHLTAEQLDTIGAASRTVLEALDQAENRAG